jgi:hypothetical protein
MRAFFQDQLSISEERLATMEWSEVVDTIVALQRSLRLCVVKDLNALDIANRIMRSENYMIALVNKRLLDLRIPWAEILRAPFVCCCRASSSASDDEVLSGSSETAADARAAVRRLEANADEDPTDQDEKDEEADGGWCRALVPRRVVLTRLLDWNVRFCVLNSMFDQEFVVRPAFLMVRRRGTFSWQGRAADFELFQTSLLKSSFGFLSFPFVFCNRTLPVSGAAFATWRSPISS